MTAAAAASAASQSLMLFTPALLTFSKGHTGWLIPAPSADGEGPLPARLPGQ